MQLIDNALEIVLPSRQLSSCLLLQTFLIISYIVNIWIRLKFFFSCSQHLLVGPVYCLKDLQISFFNETFIKNGSHSIIHTFKNYFAIVNECKCHILKGLLLQQLISALSFILHAYVSWVPSKILSTKVSIISLYPYLLVLYHSYFVLLAYLYLVSLSHEC